MSTSWRQRSNGLHTVVCAKVVPRPEEVRVDPETGNLDRANARSQFNPPDLNALEAALRLKDEVGGRVSVLSMGPPFVIPWLEWTVRMGADHIYLLSDRKFAGADTLATTYTLAQAVRRLAPVDLVICGDESSDGATGQVPPGLAQWLGWPQVTFVEELRLTKDDSTRARRNIGEADQLVESSLPAVIAVRGGCNIPRFPDFSFTLPADERVTVWTSEDIAAEDARIGKAGAGTDVAGIKSAPVGDRRREVLPSDPEAAARLLAKRLQKILAAS